MHHLHFQKRHDVTNDVNVNSLIRVVARCLKKYYFLLSTFSLSLTHVSCREFTEKLTFIFALSLHDLKKTDHTLKILTVAKVKSLPWKHVH